MILSAEVMLMLAIVGLYLYDSTLLLYCNEGILYPKGKNAWVVNFGSSNVGVFGKELYVPNPLMFHRPLFRLSWRFEGNNPTQTVDLPSHDFSALTPMVWSIAIALSMLLPLGFFTSLGDRVLLAALLLIFGNITFALVWVWLNRTKFNLSNKRFASLAFESLICPPFALNIVRHLSLNIPVSENLVTAAQRLQQAESWNKTRLSLLARLDSEINGEEPESERFKLLLEYRQSLAIEGDECQA